MELLFVEEAKQIELILPHMSVDMEENLVTSGQFAERIGRDSHEIAYPAHHEDDAIPPYPSKSSHELCNHISYQIGVVILTFIAYSCQKTAFVIQKRGLRFSHFDF